jgi:nitrate/TMAO reductase-like tetraheme cytochrome c subunit
MRDFLIALTRNGVSLLGVAITTSSAVIILTLFVLGLLGLETNPYLGILVYLILPGVFLLGLALIPLGIVIQRRRSRRAAERGEPAHEFPVLDFNRDRTRRLALIFLMLTAMNVVILAAATYKGVEVMDSAQFCGTTCHVMAPENAAYHRSPHAGVKCVACHIGPGAGWFVKAKLSGTRQVLSVNLERYPRPIPAPVENLRPAAETCGQCHWPAKFVGDQLKVVVHHADDEANTDSKTVLLLKVGGVKGRVSQGIHWHADPAVRIRYRTDAKRETIGEVELTRADGKPKTFTRAPAAGASPSAEPAAWREMDCVDCHNRPGHAHQMPDDAVDVALDEGVLDRSLPYLRRESLRLLALEQPSHEAARQAIAQGLEAFYREHYPQVIDSKGREIHAAGRALGDIYCANVFPEMKVSWGTYPNHLGHTHSPGCFRCHDGEHKAADGAAISDDCATCHAVLAMDEEKPEILGMLQP